MELLIVKITFHNLNLHRLAEGALLFMKSLKEHSPPKNMNIVCKPLLNS